MPWAHQCITTSMHGTLVSDIVVSVAEMPDTEVRDMVWEVYNFDLLVGNQVIAPVDCSCWWFQLSANHCNGILYEEHFIWVHKATSLSHKRQYHPNPDSDSSLFYSKAEMDQFCKGLKVLGVLEANFMSHFFTNKVNSRFNQSYTLKNMIKRLILELHTPADTYLP